MKYSSTAPSLPESSVIKQQLNFTGCVGLDCAGVPNKEDTEFMRLYILYINKLN